MALNLPRAAGIKEVGPTVDRISDAVVTQVNPALSQLKTLQTTPTWILVSLINGWTNMSPAGGVKAQARYLKDAIGRVWLSGWIGTGALSSAAFTLPMGYRPLTTLPFAIASNGAYGQIQVDASGNVTPTVGAVTNVALDGISFLAGT